MDQRLVKQVLESLLPKLEPTFIIIFGSHAKRINRSDSDLDIAFYKENGNFLPYDLFILSQELADFLKTEVDLINLHEASTVFAAQIFSEGEVIYSQNENIRIREQMKALSMYVKLNEDRAELLDRIEERGSVYEK